MVQRTLRWVAGNGSALDFVDPYVFSSLEGHGVPPGTHRTVPLPSRDGSVYIDTRIQDRQIIATIHVVTNSWADVNVERRRIAQLLNPKLGLGALEYRPDGTTTYVLDALVEDVRDAVVGPTMQTFTVAFRCPDPLWRSAIENQQTISIGDGGLSYPLVFPLTFVTSSATGTLTNSGDARTYPRVQAIGPSSNPRIANDTTGKELLFSGLSIASGQTLTIDMQEQTATIGTTNVLRYLTPASAFWGLEPGGNLVACVTSDDRADFVFTWHDRFSGV